MNLRWLRYKIQRQLDQINRAIEESKRTRRVLVGPPMLQYHNPPYPSMQEDRRDGR